MRSGFSIVAGALASTAVAAQPVPASISAPQALPAGPASASAPLPAQPAMVTGSQTAEAQPKNAVEDVVLPKGTPVRLMVVTEVSSKTAAIGYRFPLRVDEDVTLDHRVLIPAGTTAIAEVSAVQENGALGKSGRLGVRLLGLDLGGYRIPLVGDQTRAGRNAADKVVFSVLAFGGLGLFMSGNNAKLKGGEIVMGETGDDVLFTGRGTVERAPAIASARAPLVATELEKLAGLRDRGIITTAEFEAQKAKLLATH